MSTLQSSSERLQISSDLDSSCIALRFWNTLFIAAWPVDFKNVLCIGNIGFMMGKNHILAIDQGTTSTRVIVFNQRLQPLAVAQEEFPQYFPESGWVEHDPEDLWSSTTAMCRLALEQACINSTDIAAIGITNQRETTVVWNRHTGRAIHNAIVWQDRRTADYCRMLRDAGHESGVTRKTGLLLDPYLWTRSS